MAESGEIEDIVDDGSFDAQVDATTQPQIEDTLNKVTDVFIEIRGRPCLRLLYPARGMIQTPHSLDVYEKFNECENEIAELDVILHSAGGNIHEAYDIIKLCNKYADEVTVFVPMHAMSAATLIALGADKVVLSKIGKLGPLDPQVPHPERKEYMPC